MYLPDYYSMRFTTLSSYFLIDWWCDIDFHLFACWFDSRFCCRYLTWETSGLELASTIVLVLQANRLSKCASHPKDDLFLQKYFSGRKSHAFLLLASYVLFLYEWTKKVGPTHNIFLNPKDLAQTSAAIGWKKKSLNKYFVWV